MPRGLRRAQGEARWAILSVLLYHGLRRDELSTLKVRDIHGRRGVLHLRVHGKGGREARYLPLHPGTAELVTDYLEAAGHGEDLAGALFRPVKNNTGGTMEGTVTADGIYKMVQHYAKRVGLTSSALARTHSGPRPRPMRWITRPISPRCRSGSGTPTSPPPGSTTGGRPVRRIADV
jgi:integrase